MVGKKLVRAVTAAAVLGLASTAATAQDVTIAFTGFATSNTFWNGLGNAAKEQAESMGVELIDLTTTEPDAAAQKDAVDRAIAQGVDGIIIGSVDNRAFNDSLANAQSAGIPVVAVDTGIDHPWIASLVQTDNLAAAGIAGQYIVDSGKGDKVLILGGTLGHQTGNARRDGVKTAVEAAGGEVIFRACDWAADCAYDTTINETAANDDITAIFAAWDPGALAAVSAAKEKGIIDDVVIVGFDGNPANLESIEFDEQSATIKQDNVRMGRESVINLVKAINGESVEAFIPIDGILITKDNVAEFK